MSYSFSTFETEREWLAARRDLITSSDLPVILGLLDQVSPWQLWLEKVQGSNRESSYLMRRGHGLEAFIAEEYTRQTDRPTYDPGHYTLAMAGWKGATVDRLTKREIGCPIEQWLEDPASCCDGVLEIKAPTVYGLHKYSDGPDKYVTAQVQWQMLVTGLKFADIAVDLTTRLEVFRVHANRKLQAALEREAKRFRELVVSGTPPPADGHPLTARAMADFFSETHDEMVTLPAEAREHFELRSAAIELVDQATKERTEHENWFRRELGEAVVGNDPELSIQVTWRPDVNGTRRLNFREIQA